MLQSYAMTQGKGQIFFLLFFKKMLFSEPEDPKPKWAMMAI